MFVRPAISVLAVGALAATALSSTLPSAAAASTGHDRPGPATAFHRLATYPVVSNLPAGADPAEETVAEISDVSPDGRTLAYTDAAGGRIGFLDLTDPNAPRGLGSHQVTPGEPTSVAISPDGTYALVVVDESDGDFRHPAGRLDVVSLAAPHELVSSIDLGGQPDSIAISPDGGYAAIAIENQRDEEATADGGAGEQGDLPQAPAGFVQTLRLTGAPQPWTATPVALPEEELAGLDSPSDPEPEYVSINAENQLAVTLQENNGVAIVDLPSARLTTVWSAGSATVDGVDTVEDGRIDLTGGIEAPREPDALAWVGDGLVATANEGDWKGGTRGWTVFEAGTGEVAWDAGSSFEHLATAHGLANEGRAETKGAEPEGLAFAEFDGVPYAFVGSERSNVVAVYDMSDPREPALRQLLPTAIGPEGLLPVPERNLMVVSSEEDSAEDGYRAAVGVYRLGRGQAAFPSIVSAPERRTDTPIGWTALGALAADPRERSTLWAASDAALSSGWLYRVDARRSPAVITDAIEVTEPSGAAPELDIEGLATRRDGGFWAASEGAIGAENALLRLSRDGVIRERVSLPDEVADGLGSQGLEGVTVTGHGRSEQVYVALQRSMEGEERVRIGRYTPATGEWRWFGYELEQTEIEGDWIGLSEVVATGPRTLAVIERDKQSGPAASVKQITTVRLPSPGAVERAGDTVLPVEKRVVRDVLPDLRATHGWTQEKLEGLAVTRDGQAYAVTDNDGLDDATGETVFLRLGRLDH